MKQIKDRQIIHKYKEYLKENTKIQIKLRKVIRMDLLAQMKEKVTNIHP